MRLLRGISLLVICCGFLTSAQPAQAGPAASCSSDPVCTQLANQARERSGMGLLEDAQRYYASAYEMANDPKLLYERARVIHKLGRYAEAVSLYRKFLDTDTSGNEKQRRKVEQYLDQAQAEARDAPATPPPAPASPLPPPVINPTPTPTPSPVLAPTPETSPTPTPAPVVTKPAPPPPVVVAKKLPPPKPKEPLNLHKKWWFWTAVGVGVAGIAIGAGLGVASRPPDLTGTVEYQPFGN